MRVMRVDFRKLRKTLFILFILSALAALYYVFVFNVNDLNYKRKSKPKDRISGSKRYLTDIELCKLNGLFRILKTKEEQFESELSGLNFKTLRNLAETEQGDKFLEINSINEQVEATSEFVRYLRNKSRFHLERRKQTLNFNNLSSSSLPIVRVKYFYKNPASSTRTMKNFYIPRKLTDQF